MKFGLTDEEITKIQNIFQKYPQIESVIIYGSRAMNTYKNGSDIDLTMKGNIDHSTLLNVLHDLNDLYLPYLFDISIYSQIENNDLITHIQKYGKIFYTKTSITQ